MTRYSGNIGYAEQSDFKGGIWENGNITVRHYYGDVTKDNNLRLQNGSDLLPDISVSNSISVVADAYAYDHFWNIKWIEWQGVKWVVSNVEVKRPRLILELGGVYNGPTN